MAENSKIEWTTHTFNPWRGCTKVSAGCANCYAETLSGRNPKTLGVWGPNGTRVVASEAMWKEPVKWNKLAGLADRHNNGPHERPRVFCASLADVFEGQDTMPETAHLNIAAARQRLWYLIEQTPNLDWLLLTKRPQNVPHMTWPKWHKQWPSNVWLGTSVENQAAADERIPHLLRTSAAMRFLSCEPLLEKVYLRKAVSSVASGPIPEWDGREARMDGLHWVIVGCESGPRRRPMNLEWAESLVDQCRSAGVAVFVKQLEVNGKVSGDIEMFPESLRIREFPNAGAS